jgi:hypothetical protein
VTRRIPPPCSELAIATGGQRFGQPEKHAFSGDLGGTRFALPGAQQRQRGILMVMSESRVVELSYRPNPVPDAWVLPEEPVPESRPHDLTIDRLKALLGAWIEKSGRDAIVTRNLAVR